MAKGEATATAPRGAPDNDDLLVAHDGAIKALEKQLAELRRENDALAEAVAGRLTLVEQAVTDIRGLLEAGDSGRPDVLARNVLGRLLQLLDAEKREMVPVRRAIALEALRVGAVLIPKPARPAGHAAKQDQAREMRSHG